MTDSFSGLSYLEDVLHQPEAMRDTLMSWKGMDYSQLSAYGQKLSNGKLARVVLTGMGSSYHALYPLMLGLLRAGIPCQMVETSELIHHMPGLISASGLTVAVSQSGCSVEILELIKRLPSNALLVGITNTPGSPLVSRADMTILTRAGVENTVSCKTYITSLAGLVLLEYGLTGHDPSMAVTALWNLPEALQDYLSNMQSNVEDLEKRLKGIGYLILAGRGGSMAAVGTGGLIIKEAAHFPAEGMSCAAFRHGPLEMSSPQTFVLVYEGMDPTRELNRNLVKDILKVGGKAVLVEVAADRQVFHLPAVHPSGLPILEILPAQMLSIALARLHDHVPGQFSWSSKVTSRE